MSTKINNHSAEGPTFYWERTQRNSVKKWSPRALAGLPVARTTALGTLSKLGWTEGEWVAENSDVVLWGRKDEPDSLWSPCSHCGQMPTFPLALEVRAADTCFVPESQPAAADQASRSGKNDLLRSVLRSLYSNRFITELEGRYISYSSSGE